MGAAALMRNNHRGVLWQNARAGHLVMGVGSRKLLVLQIRRTRYRSLARPFANELDQRVVNFLGVRRTQKVSAASNSHQISRLRVLEKLDLLFSVGHRVDGIVGTLIAESVTELRVRPGAVTSRTTSIKRHSSRTEKLT